MRALTLAFACRHQRKPCPCAEVSAIELGATPSAELIDRGYGWGSYGIYWLVALPVLSAARHAALCR
jgi:hypothetical protein